MNSNGNGKKTINAFCAALAFIFAASVFAACDRSGGSFTVRDTLPAANAETARVVILAGQSNASGCSIGAYLEKNVTADKFAEYKNGYENVYVNVFSSGNNVSDGFIKASAGQGETPDHFGPEVGLAEKLNELFPDEKIFIVKYAWGGTNLFEQWLSPSSKGKTGSLYKSFIGYVKKSLDYLASKGYAPIIEGLCWMQGESDSFSQKNADDYKIHLENFISDVRKDLAKYSSVGGIAFIDAYIADNPVFWVYCKAVNASKKAVADTSDINVVIDTHALGLTCDKEPEDSPDMAHYDSLSEIKLGNAFAEEVAKFFD